MTIDNLEKHTEAYTKKLRDHGRLLKLEVKKVEDIKQMEIEDLMSKLVAIEFKQQQKDTMLMKIELAYRLIKPSLEEKEAIIEDLSSKFEDEEEKVFSLKHELQELKEQLEQKEKEFNEYQNEKIALERENISLKESIEGKLILDKSRSQAKRS